MARRKKPEAISVPTSSGRGILTRLQGKLAPHYVLRLYIAGTNLNSIRAIKNVRRLCMALRPSRVNLDIIDLFQQSELAKKDDIVAAPALIKEFPEPRRVFVGDLSDLDRVFTGLGIATRIEDEGIKPGQKEHPGRD
jgi:circadian clock protein KaiB